MNLDKPIINSRKLFDRLSLKKNIQIKRHFQVKMGSFDRKDAWYWPFS